ncbi:MAG TPA: hypothetical protein PKD21_08615 [Candidatus Competibacter phosphatis]|nr:hypothetical protein [Gammaproteobacteria bacterium]HMQ13495.1 hypothetical protein [Candidatus Competibacter phosphatis]
MSKTTMFSLFTQPHIFYTSKGVQKTNFLFAIFDKVEVAWYIYDENSEEFRLAEEADLLRDNFDTTDSRFAGEISFGQGFVPKNVARDSEFSSGLIQRGRGPTAALARFSLHRTGNHIKIYMNVYLKTGPQLIELRLLNQKIP